MLEIGKEQLAWNKEKYEQIAPYVTKALQQQQDITGKGIEHADEQWQQYKDLFAPIEKQYATEALAEGSPAQQEAEAERARAQVAGSYEAQRGATSRDLARMGVNPNAARFADFERISGNEQAAAEAGASNTARTNARLRGLAMRQGAAQFGRGMPSTGIASDQLALAGASGGVNTAGQSMAIRNAGIGSAAPWYGGAVGANTAAGNLYLGQFGAQMQGYQAQTAADNQLFGGLGNIGGMVLSAGSKPWWLMARGGVIGLRGVTRKGYAAGGVVRGPGTSTSDSVPAEVDGEQPAALSTGEAVLNVPAVKLVGEDFVHRVNKIGLMLKTIMEKGVMPPGVANGARMPA